MATIRPSPLEVKSHERILRARVCANFAARPVFHHGAPCVAAANGARRSLPMASTACVSPSASLRLPLPHGCQDIFTDTRSACLSGFQGSIPLPAQTARGGSLKACPERSRTDPQDLGMDRLAEAFPYGCATPIRHPQSSVALRFEAATHMPRYFHTHGRTRWWTTRCGGRRRGRAGRARRFWRRSRAGAARCDRDSCRCPRRRIVPSSVRSRVPVRQSSPRSARRSTC